MEDTAPGSPADTAGVSISSGAAASMAASAAAADEDDDCCIVSIICFGSRWRLRVQIMFLGGGSLSAQRGPVVPGVEPEAELLAKHVSSFRGPH